MADTAMKFGFEMDGRVLALESLLPMHPVNAAKRKTEKYAAILSSIREVGIIEPPVVYPMKGGNSATGQYMLLDGHLRVDALKQLGFTETFCLISTDDEGYTYNQHVNRLTAIQEHFMIRRALDNGVDEDRIARALNVDVAKIRRQRSLIEGICPEAVDLLKTKPLSPCALSLLKKVSPMRQIEIAELMNCMNNYKVSYIQALVAHTSSKDRVQGKGDLKTDSGIKPEDIARMEKEMSSLEHNFKLIQDTYGINNLKLMQVRGYLIKLLNNARVIRFLAAHYAEFLGEFQKIIDATSLDA